LSWCTLGGAPLRDFLHVILYGFMIFGFTKKVHCLVLWISGLFWIFKWIRRLSNSGTSYTGRVMSWDHSTSQGKDGQSGRVRKICIIATAQHQAANPIMLPIRILATILEIGQSLWHHWLANQCSSMEINVYLEKDLDYQMGDRVASSRKKYEEMEAMEQWPVHLMQRLCATRNSYPSVPVYSFNTACHPRKKQSHWSRTAYMAFKIRQ